MSYGFRRTNQPPGMNALDVSWLQNRYVPLQNWLQDILPYIDPNGGGLTTEIHTHFQNALDSTNQLLDYLDNQAVDNWHALDIRLEIHRHLELAAPEHLLPVFQLALQHFV
ncbi:hypothetical protein N7540_012583 [Penicillium herquei]|nr:hypothetical protein N7540_012583 [Penicillium herquei]